MQEQEIIHFLFQYLQITKRRQAERLLKKYVSQDMLVDEEYTEHIQRVLTDFLG